MLKQFLIVFLFILRETLYSSSEKTALFISIPYVGHINPLIHQAVELYQRHDDDYNIYIISCSNVKDHVEKNCLNTTIKFLDLGQCQNETDLNLNYEQFAAEPQSHSIALKLMESLVQNDYPKMYEQMLNVIKSDLFDKQETVIAVIDLLTYAGADISDYFNITYIINNANIVPYLGWEYILPADYNPSYAIYPPQSIDSIGTNLLLRTLLPIMRPILSIYVYFRFDRPYNYLRQNKFHLNKTYSLSSRYQSHMILVNNAFGLEYPLHLPPYVQLTGPMLSMKHPLNNYLTQLSDEDQKWIESDSRPIIYINFGTCVPISDRQIFKIYDAIKTFEEYRFLWKLKGRDLLPNNIPSNIYIVKWISSTLGVLAHSKVDLFISHCGINSVYESIWVNTSVLCIPILADQHDMAQRLQDSGAGRWLDKLKFTSDELKETIKIMLNKNEMIRQKKNIKRLQALMKLHGGVERAVDLIEMIAEHGIESFLPIHNSYPWYAYYNLDIYVIWLLIIIGLRQLIVRCCCCYRSTGKKLKRKTS